MLQANYIFQVGAFTPHVVCSHHFGILFSVEKHFEKQLR